MPLHWKCEVLATGLPGKSFSLKNDLCGGTRAWLWHMRSPFNELTSHAGASLLGEGLSTRVGAALESRVWAFHVGGFSVFSCGSAHSGLGAVAHGLSRPTARGTLPDQEPNPLPPRRQAGLRGSPRQGLGSLLWHMASLVRRVGPRPPSRDEPSPLHQERRGLATGLPGKSFLLEPLFITGFSNVMTCLIYFSSCFLNLGLLSVSYLGFCFH